MIRRTPTLWLIRQIVGHTAAGQRPPPRKPQYKSFSRVNPS